MKATIWITTCVCLVWVFSKSLASVIFSDRDLHHVGGKFCGSRLSDILSIVCGGKYNAPHKKSGKYCRKYKRGLYYILCYHP